MSLKKGSNAEIIVPKKSSSTGSSERTVGASPQIVSAMGIGGAFLGILSGLNHWPPVPADMLAPEVNAAWLGAILGQPHLDYASAAQYGFLGLTIGLGSASSFNFGLGQMLRAWLLAGMGLALGLLMLKSAMAAAGGFILGWMVALAGPSSD